MNQCALCMTENHEPATVCLACGAVKMLIKYTLSHKLMWVKSTLSV